MNTVKGRLITPAEGEVIIDFPLYLFLTPHCQVAEAANTSADDDIKFFWNDTIEHTLNMFEDIRSILVAGGIVNYMPLSSVERTEEFNREHGGIEGSHHITGEAFDWNYTSGLRVKMTDPLRKLISAIWQFVCQANGVTGYICWYTHGFHFDCAVDGDFKIYDYRGTSKDW